MRQLSDVHLRELVARLCEAELRNAGLPVSAVRRGGPIRHPMAVWMLTVVPSVTGFTATSCRARSGLPDKKRIARKTAGGELRPGSKNANAANRNSWIQEFGTVFQPDFRVVRWRCHYRNNTSFNVHCVVRERNYVCANPKGEDFGCSFASPTDRSLGNLRRQSLKSIWYHAADRHFFEEKKGCAGCPVLAYEDQENRDPQLNKADGLIPIQAVIDEVCDGLSVPRGSVMPWHNGTRAHSFIVADNFVLRATRREEAAVAYANERIALELLADCEVVPKLQAYGAEDGLHWQLTTLCPGVPVSSVWPMLTQAERCSLSQSAAGQLKRLHLHERPPASLMEWRRAPVIERCRSEAFYRGRLTEAEFERVEACIAVLDVDDVAENRLVHGDWHFGNLLCDGTCVTGIVDLEWAGSGSFARDLCIGDYFDAQAFGSWRMFLKAFMCHRGVDEADLTEIARWTLIWKLRQVSTRRNTSSAQRNRQVLLSICSHVEQSGFAPPTTRERLFDFLSIAT